MRILGACVITPIYQQYLEVRCQRLKMEHGVSQLQQRLEQNNFLIQAARSDAQYNEFIARNELNYHKPGQQSIHIQPLPVQADRAGDKLSASEIDQLILLSTGRWWQRMFVNKHNRVILLIMAGASLAIAILICKPHRTPRITQARRPNKVNAETS